MRLDSSSLSSVTWVSITRYTLWQRLSTLGLWVVTMQVLLGCCFTIFFRTVLSVVTSSADVASSRRRIGASLRTALAIAILCACPSDRPRPLSPTLLLICRGSFSTKSQAHATFSASMISSSVASSFTILMFSAMVPERIVFPWGT